MQWQRDPKGSRKPQGVTFGFLTDERLSFVLNVGFVVHYGFCVGFER